MEARTEGSGAEPTGAKGVPPWAEPVSRRSVLKGIGAGALAMGAGGFLEACSNSIKGSGGGSAGKITIGFVSPQTGALAGFASGDNFVVDTIRKTGPYKSGFKVGGKTYTVDILVKDSQSDPNRASEVTRELINTDHADIVVTSSTPETTNPVATACETAGVPCVSTVVPWQAWYFARQADPANPQPFKYTTMYFFGAEAFGGCFIPMWDRIPTNKVVAGQWPNDPDGNAFRAAWPGMAKSAGYTIVDGGAYQDGTTDYTSMISKFKSKDCEVFTNAPLPPDFNTFWKQASQQGFKPKLATVAKVLLFPADTEALGDLVNNIATDSWWGPYMPFKSSLDGMTTQQLVDSFQTSSGKQWLQSLGSTYSLFEVAHQAMTAAADPHDKNAVAAELFKVNYAGMSGPLDFTVGPHIDPADQNSPTIPGIGIVNPVGVQWKKGTNFPWEMVVVDNSLNSDVQIGGDLVATNP
jgi:branched-chain amino acid transport system substrate-binding protein